MAKILNATPEKSFWVNKGPVLKNIVELKNALIKMDQRTFGYHVNKNKNDFATWIKDVFGYSDLAQRLRHNNTIKDMEKSINNYLRLLSKKSTTLSRKISSRIHKHKKRR